MQRPPSFAAATLAGLAACTGTPSNPSPDATLDPPTNGFQVTSPDVTIMPGQEVTYCYYFRTPNQRDVVIKRWASAMTPGSHHMIMYTTTTDAAPPGTLSTKECGGFGGAAVPSWTYAAQTPTAEVALPLDDGNGVPLGQEVAANTPAYFQMHYLNATDAPIQAHVTLNAEAYEPGTKYVRTAAYVTYNSFINIPAGATDHLESMTCNVPANTKFWTVSTHSHKQSIKTVVKDGTSASTTTVFSSTSWEHPGAMLWATTPYFSFTTNKLTYECTYNNTGDNKAQAVVAGPSAATNEMCMATGYYFPATKPLLCLNSLGPF